MIPPSYHAVGDAWQCDACGTLHESGFQAMICAKRHAGEKQAACPHPAREWEAINGAIYSTCVACGDWDDSFATFGLEDASQESLGAVVAAIKAARTSKAEGRP